MCHDLNGQKLLLVLLEVVYKLNRPLTFGRCLCSNASVEILSVTKAFNFCQRGIFFDNTRYLVVLVSYIDF